MYIWRSDSIPSCVFKPVFVFMGARRRGAAAHGVRCDEGAEHGRNEKDPDWHNRCRRWSEGKTTRAWPEIFGMRSMHEKESGAERRIAWMACTSRKARITMGMTEVGREGSGFTVSGGQPEGNREGATWSRRDRITVHEHRKREVVHVEWCTWGHGRSVRTLCPQRKLAPGKSPIKHDAAPDWSRRREVTEECQRVGVKLGACISMKGMLLCSRNVCMERERESSSSPQATPPRPPMGLIFSRE
ncbi:hypothetical protein B0H19DRAFT_1071238 [Mycena capillaripes]|nr:hypothetical protein B0H19DRAFT_1071238 [Mycena capillaripes]